MNKNIFDMLDTQDISLLDREIDEQSINVLDKSGYSLLHICISRSYDPISAFLIEKGIDTNNKDKNSQTALHYSAFYNKIQIAENLLAHGADIHIADNFGNQPLWTAVFNDKGFGNRIDIIKIFLKYGADINHKNNASRSPLDLAKNAGYTAIINLLSEEK